MSSVWYSTDAYGDRKRSWVIEHSRGASFRSLDLPLSVTRKMERIFLASYDHLALAPALRRAELLACGVPVEFIEAIMLTRLATDLQHGDFWRTVWMFLVRQSADMESRQIGPMIDYIHAVRHASVRIETQDGLVEVLPPQPDFCMKGRTVSSLLRLMRGWHRQLGGDSAFTFSWARSTFKPWLFEEPRLVDSAKPRRWHMMELNNSAQLREEGVALHHCVSSYAYLCQRGSSSIWSLRVWRGETMRSVLTVEVDPRRRIVIQARGKANRSASGKSLQVLRQWAVREGLTMAV
jgi:hypothetical protein